MYRIGELVGDDSWQSSVDYSVSVMYISVFLLERLLCAFLTYIFGFFLVS